MTAAIAFPDWDMWALSAAVRSGHRQSTTGLCLFPHRHIERSIVTPCTVRQPAPPRPLCRFHSDHGSSHLHAAARAVSGERSASPCGRCPQHLCAENCRAAARDGQRQLAFLTQPPLKCSCTMGFYPNAPPLPSCRGACVRVRPRGGARLLATAPPGAAGWDRQAGVEGLTKRRQGRVAGLHGKAASALSRAAFGFSTRCCLLGCCHGPAVLRCRQPGRPTADCLFADVSRDQQSVLKVRDVTGLGCKRMLGMGISSWERVLSGWQLEGRAERRPAARAGDAAPVKAFPCRSGT